MIELDKVVVIQQEMTTLRILKSFQCRVIEAQDGVEGIRKTDD